MTALRHFAVATAVLSFFLLTACENQHPDNIPAGAMLNTEGSGVISATAPTAGAVYVYDVGADRVIYSGIVAKGQVVTVNTDKNKVMIDGTTATDRTLNQWNKHRIYFDDHPVIEKRVTIEETTRTP